MAELILVADDEPKIVRVARDYLERHGFRVLTAGDGQVALAVARREQPDLIILDLMMPKLDGREVCKILRAESSVPIIMLTALGEEIDQVTGLELGADDYITKPFSPRALVARVRAQLRRQRGAAGGEGLVRAGGLQIDPQRHSAAIDGVELTLTPNEFRLLYLLAGRPGQTFKRAQLLESLKGDSAAFDRSVDSHIKNLRKKLQAAAGRQLIETVYGVGYRFVAT